MNDFKEIRQKIRKLGYLQYWGIQRGYNIDKNGRAKRRFFIVQKSYPMGPAFECYEKWYNVERKNKK